MIRRLPLASNTAVNLTSSVRRMLFYFANELGDAGPIVIESRSLEKADITNSLLVVVSLTDGERM